MQVYKFLQSKYGLRAVRERRLKISEVRTLNDPFDLLPFDLSDPALRQAVVAARTKTGEDVGLLCFSRHWYNPVLWTHYGDSHRGLCLGFDVPDERTKPITYVDRPIKLEHFEPETADRMLYTKYQHWVYEEEVRVGALLQEKSGCHYFHAFDDELRLVEVIVGAGCPVSQRTILRALGTHQYGVTILKARLAYDAFRVVEDEHGFA